jgi:putative peptidoglycan lipid II flippase
MKKLLQSSIIVSAALILVRFAGLLRELALAYAYGAGIISDAFVAAYTLPSLAMSFIVTSTVTTYITIYSSIQEEERRHSFTNNLITLFTIVSLVFTVLFFCFPSVFIRIVASQAHGETLALADSLLRWMGLATLPILLSSILKARMQVERKFFISTIYLVFNSIFIIAGILLARATGKVIFMAVGMVAGNALSFFVLVSGNRKADLQYHPMIDFSDANLNRFFLLIAPIMLSSILVEVNKIIDRTMASSLISGTMTMLNYASKVTAVFTTFIGTAIGTAIYPQMTVYAANGQNEKMKSSMIEALKILLPLVIPVLIGFIVLAEPITRILFERGKFIRVNTLDTAIYMKFYATTMLTASVNGLLTRAFYASKDTHRPAIISGCCVAFNILLNFLLIGVLGARGLALSTSIAGVVSSVLLYVFLSKKIGSILVFSNTADWLKLGIGAASMGLFVWLGNRFLPMMDASYISSMLMLAGLVGAAVLLYGGLLLALRMETAHIALGAIKRLLAGRKNHEKHVST